MSRGNRGALLSKATQELRHGLMHVAFNLEPSCTVLSRLVQRIVDPYELAIM